jgi:hypothetical protein
VVTPVVLPQSSFGRAPRRPLERAPWCELGLLSFCIITATIGDVATAAVQTDIPAGCNVPRGLCGLDAPGPRETEMSCPIRLWTIFRRRRQMPCLFLVVGRRRDHKDVTERLCVGRTTAFELIGNRRLRSYQGDDSPLDSGVGRGITTPTQHFGDSVLAAMRPIEATHR